MIEQHQLPGGGSIARIRLNRPQAHNALTHDMCLQIRSALMRWTTDDEVMAVLVTSNSELAFCAGGDVRAIYKQGQEDLPGAKQFFNDEYAMNQMLYHFPKPYIALLDGIVMGGGAGISIHGSHPVVTEKTIFAMPEARIGFFPDVGMSYHLARMPHQLGYYCGLTGNSIGPAECVTSGLATHMIDRTRLNELIDSLCTLTDLTHDNCHQRIDTLLAEYSIELPTTHLLEEVEQVERCFAERSINEIKQALADHEAAWAQDMLAQLQYNAPHSLEVTLQVLQDSAQMAMDDVIKRDKQLSHEFLQGKNFYEGIRAQLIDKDKQPNWQD